MCDCIKYKDFFTENNNEEFSFLKEELSNSQQLEPTEYEKKLIDLYNPPNNFSLRKIGIYLKIDKNAIEREFKKLYIKYPHLIQKKERLPIPHGMSNDDYEIYKKISFPSKNDRTKYIRNYRQKKGQCLWCGEPARLNPDGTHTTYCEKHSQYVHSFFLKRRQDLKQLGKCIDCGEPAQLNPDGTHTTYCAKHKKYHLDRQLGLVRSRRKSGLCVVCGEPAEKNVDGSVKKFCEKHKKVYVKLNKVLRQKQKQKAVDYKGGKCMQCGYNKSMAAMDFHHRDRSQKDKNWKKLRRYGLDKLKNELDKCDLLCKNCHAVVENEGTQSNSVWQKFRKLACLDYKKTNKCTKCNLQKDRRALAFHHVDPSQKDKNFKNFNKWSEWDGWRPNQELSQRIRDELDKCVVLCANCHAEEHWDSATDDVTDEYDKEIPEEECTDDNCKHSH